MNRRVFLLGTRAACSGMTQPAPRARPEPKRPRAPGVPTSGVRDNTLFESQVRASPLALRGDVLVQSAAGELRAWNAMTLRRTDTWALPHRHFCFVQDGTLVALGFGQVGTTIHRIANGAPARRADEVYASAGEHVYLVRGAEVAAMLPHPGPRAWNRDQLVGLGDGRLVGIAGDGGLRVLDASTGTTHPTPGRRVMHLGAATRDRVWYSYETPPGGEGNAHALVLAPLARPTADELAIDVAPARIVHARRCGRGARARAARPAGVVDPRRRCERRRAVARGGAPRCRARIRRSSTASSRSGIAGACSRPTTARCARGTPRPARRSDSYRR